MRPELDALCYCIYRQPAKIFTCAAAYTSGCAKRHMCLDGQVGHLPGHLTKILKNLPESLQARNTLWRQFVVHSCFILNSVRYKLQSLRPCLTSQQELHIEHANGTEQLTLPPSVTRLACSSKTAITMKQAHPMLRVRGCCCIKHRHHRCDGSPL